MKENIYYISWETSDILENTYRDDEGRRNNKVNYEVNNDCENIPN